jgi:hypothetical protein
MLQASAGDNVAKLSVYTVDKRGTASVLGSNEITGVNTIDYRVASVKYNGVVNNFYPEVLMAGLAYSTNITKWSQIANAAYEKLGTIGEYERKAQSSTLYLYRVKNTQNDTANTITGTTYSDSASGSTSTSTYDKITVAAGSDVYVKANLDTVSLNLYGYALDLIDKTKDSSKYTSIVKSGEDINKAWSNSKTYNATLKAFANWADTMLTSGNYAVDFELYVDNDKKADNFSGTIGDIKRASYTDTSYSYVSEDGVYTIVVENGDIVRTDEGGSILMTNKTSNTTLTNTPITAGDYNQLIKQIAEDYGVTYNEAVTIFEDSGIYTAILSAIESST